LTKAYSKYWRKKYPEPDRATPVQLLDELSRPPSQTISRAYYASAVNAVEKIAADEQKWSNDEDWEKLTKLREDVQKFYDRLPESTVETRSQVMVSIPEADEEE